MSAIHDKGIDTHGKIVLEIEALSPVCHANDCHFIGQISKLIPIPLILDIDCHCSTDQILTTNGNHFQGRFRQSASSQERFFILQYRNGLHKRQTQIDLKMRCGVISASTQGIV